MNLKFTLILFLSVARCAFASDFINPDSLITENINNLVYIKHKVSDGETLYSLLKKYNANSAEVINVNPELSTNGNIKKGQYIKFPLIVNGKHVSAAYYKKKNKPVKNESPGVHLVKAGETIFSLSKQYKIDISDFVISNQITDNKIKIGQKLIIEPGKIEELVKKHNTTEKEVIVYKPVGKKYLEEGLAEVIGTKNKTNKMLAMHRNAPKGSTIKITNEANGQFVIAKVVGHLKPYGADQDIMIKLSPYAYYALRPKDSRIRAKVEYYSTKK